MGRVKLSVLIPTLESRRSMLEGLMSTLHGQALEAGLDGKFEIVTNCDQGKKPTGVKRNELIEEADGDFVAFVDDDDEVSTTYVRDIINLIETVPNLDCVGFFGNVYFKRTEFAGKMIHSIACPTWSEDGKAYYRPPNHLNPVRRNIAATVKFRPITISEDHFWSLDLLASNKVKMEVFLGAKPLYFYRCGEPRKQL